MSEKLEALFVASRQVNGLKGATLMPYKLFRTRAAARRFVKTKLAKSNRYNYSVERVTWGPEK